jgi:anaerobic selenocysteine-containing dehydrogenase
MATDVRHSACPLDCPDLCHLEVEVSTADGRVQRVNGGSRTPITDGFVCGKVRNIAEHMYGEDRVLHPLIRTGAKGDGRFRRATWDEALDLVAQRIDRVVETRGGEAVLPFHYDGSNGWLTGGGSLAKRFFRRLGASRLLRTFCAMPSHTAANGLYGPIPGTALEDYEHAKLITLWGVNPSATGIHLVPVIQRAIDRGAKLAVVDPRRTPLARRAHLHLAPRPGTDVVVALAVIRALFERGRAALGFLHEHATGVDLLRERAQRWTLDEAARVSGVAAAELDRFVELYAASSPAVVRCGWGVERNRNGGGAVAAVLAIPAVAGKLGVRGGGFTMSNGDARWGVTPEHGIRAREPSTRAINMSQLATALTEVRDPSVDVLFVYNCNPLATAPNQEGVRRGLAREDLFTVVHEQVMTDTARWADVVLPATVFLEHRELRRGYGAMRMYDSPAVATPPGEARSNNELFGALIDRLGLGKDGEPRTDEELVGAILDGARGAEIRAQIASRGAAVPTDGAAPILFVDHRPATPDGKIHLVPEALDREAPGGLYAYREDPGTAEFPLALISPSLASQITSTFGQLRRGEVPLEISPADAAARGIADGDVVRMWNALGEVIVAAKISKDVRAGVVVLPKGLWRHHTRNGSTANALVPETLADLGGGACYNDARVEVARA